jgi:hypothetical protein
MSTKEYVLIVEGLADKLVNLQDDKVDALISLGANVHGLSITVPTESKLYQMKYKPAATGDVPGDLSNAGPSHRKLTQSEEDDIALSNDFQGDEYMQTKGMSLFEPTPSILSNPGHPGNPNTASRPGPGSSVNARAATTSMSENPFVAKAADSVMEYIYEALTDLHYPRDFKEIVKSLSFQQRDAVASKFGANALRYEEAFYSAHKMVKPDVMLMSTARAKELGAMKHAMVKGKISMETLAQLYPGIVPPTLMSPEEIGIARRSEIIANRTAMQKAVERQSQENRSNLLSRGAAPPTLVNSFTAFGAAPGIIGNARQHQSVTPAIANQPRDAAAKAKKAAEDSWLPPKGRGAAKKQRLVKATRAKGRIVEGGAIIDSEAGMAEQINRTVAKNRIGGY